MDKEVYTPMDKKENSPGSEVNEALPKYEKRYTYSDYIQWDDDERWELIDGVPYLMSAPNRRHQEISGNLYTQLRNFLKGKPCKVYYAPFDVRLNADTFDNTVVQPDIVVVCDSSKLDKRGCNGAPDFILEILSPSTARYDRIIKLEAYRRAGVREYWIVDPDTKTVQVCIYKDGLYFVEGYTDADTVLVRVLDGCKIDLSEIFRDDL